MITVAEILKHNDARLIAGSDGIHKKISWASMVNVHDVETKELIDGEFVFSTGLGLSTKKEMLGFIRTLISANCSGLFLEDVMNKLSLDEDVLSFCNANAFPLIVDNSVVSISKLIQGINDSVLNDESDYYGRGEEYYHHLLEKDGNDISEHILYTAVYLGIDVAYWHILSEPVSSDVNFDPRTILSAELMDKIDSLSDRDEYIGDNFAVAKIEALDERYAYIIFKADRAISRFELYILNRLTSFLRTRVINSFVSRIQKKHIVDASWIRYWFEGRIGEFAVKEKLRELDISEKVRGYYVCLINIPGGDKNAGSLYEIDYHNLNDLVLKISINVFRTMRQFGFKTVEYYGEGYLKYLIVVPEDMRAHRSKLDEALKTVLAKEEAFTKYPEIRIAISRKANDISNVPLSYQTALFASEMKCTHGERILTYAKLGYLNIIERMRNEYILEEYVHDTLHELLNEENEELLDTLKEYVFANYSKQETSKNLYIVRQTLYSRLDQIKEILGEDFDQGERRLSIELAIRALEFMS